MGRKTRVKRHVKKDGTVVKAHSRSIPSQIKHKARMRSGTFQAMVEENKQRIRLRANDYGAGVEYAALIGNISEFELDEARDQLVREKKDLARVEADINKVIAKGESTDYLAGQRAAHEGNIDDLTDVIWRKTKK